MSSRPMGLPKYATDTIAEAQWGNVDNSIVMPIYYNTTAKEVRVFKDDEFAIGKITSSAKAAYSDGELLTLTDGAGVTVIFEFDESGGNSPAAGNVEIDISGDTTDINVADTIRTAVDASVLDLATDGAGAALINITLDDAGRAAQVASSITETSAGIALTADFTLPWFSADLTRP